MARKLDTAGFIEKSRACHGDRYDYSLAEYRGQKSRIEIVCPDHGVFEQWPTHHYRGTGCPACSGKARHTNESFIKKARAIHGDYYDYSLVDIKNTKTQVRIVCPKHGEFLQTPSDHFRSGCVNCGHEKSAAARKLTEEEFLNRAEKVHRNSYGYENLELCGVDTPVRITCPKHGEFQQTPYNHLMGKGCSLCGIERMKSKQCLNLESFCERAHLVHGDTYDYSKVKYVNNRVKISIVCPEHGVFSQAPYSHLVGSGCPDCAMKNLGKGRRTPVADFIAMANELHGHAYDYSQVVYINARTKVRIGCPEHGIFEQAPDTHLRPAACDKCASVKRAENQTWTRKQFIEAAEQVHGDRYDYSLVDYTNQNVKVRIICPDHGFFDQVPGSHLTGTVCPNCCEYGFRPGEPGALYYARIDRPRGTPLYMIGITNRSFEKRYTKAEQAHMTLIKQWHYKRGDTALKRESAIKRENRQNLFRGKTPLREKGNTTISTEIFTLDILGLDVAK